MKTMNTHAARFGVVALLGALACASDPVPNAPPAPDGSMTAEGGSTGKPDASAPTDLARPDAGADLTKDLVTVDMDRADRTGADSARFVGTDGPAIDRATGKIPAAILDLSNWKLTLPVADPFEVKQPLLGMFSLAPFFQVNPTGAVLFQAPCGGHTTKNSSYPRSELREMTGGGKDEAAWSTDQGTHTMIITQAITRLPTVKPHVVAGQIHDADDDVIMIRLERARLFVEGGGKNLGDLDLAYQLGTKFTVKIEATGGQIRVFYNELTTPKVTIARSVKGCYFKAGVYTQSNLKTGDDASAFGEVLIDVLQVSHR